MAARLIYYVWNYLAMSHVPNSQDYYKTFKRVSYKDIWNQSIGAETKGIKVESG